MGDQGARGCSRRVRTRSVREDQRVMRIVHTSDWHAGRIWKARDRLDELQAIFDELAGFIEHDKIDVLLVLGDVFVSGEPAQAVERAVFRVMRRVGRTGVKL